MELSINRKYKKDLYCIGELSINGEFFCHTLEDKDRGLTSSMSEEEIKAKKVYGETAIPTGTYKIDMDTVSPKYSKRIFYKTTCKGKVPRLVSVKGFSGILIHTGNTQQDTAGCILVGVNDVKGKVTQSKATFTVLYQRMLDARNRGEEITITIK